jgi:glycosyltransferase involved in cell wall biosynthesis
MHVAFVTPEFIKDGRLYPGGLATYLYTASKALMARNVRVSVYTLSDRDGKTDFEGIEVHEVLNRAPLPLRPFAKILSLAVPGAVFQTTASLCLNRRIADDRIREGIDVIHYTNWKSVGLFRIRKGSLVRISSYERLWDNDPANGNLDKKICQWLEATSLRRFSTIIGPGAYLASIIRRELRLPREIRIVPTPIGQYPLSSERSFRADGMKMVMYAGTLSRIKGAPLLFDIIDEYLKEHSDTLFLVIGKPGTADGRSVRSQIESMSGRHGSRFVYHENLGKADLMSAYRQSDLVLIPSLIDNFPNTALEAASQGTLLMASDTASLDSLLEDGRNAFVMSSRSPADWVKAIRKTLSLDTETRQSMSREMSVKLKEHVPENAIERLCEVYSEVRQGNRNH